MTSTNSSANIFVLLKNVFRRNIAVFAVSQIAVLLLTLFSTVTITPYTDTPYFAETNLYSTVLISILQSFIIPLLLFRELYSKQASDFILSLPVKRSTFYNANILFGVISITVSYIIAFAVTVPVLGMKFAFSYFVDFVSLAPVFYVTVLALFMLFSFCAVISGRKWHYFLTAYISASLIMTGFLGVIGYLNTVWGLGIEINYGWYPTPSGLMLLEYMQNDQNLILMAVISLLQLVLAYTVGFIVFKRRKAEVAESTLAGKWAPAVLILLGFLAVIFFCLGLVERVSLTARIIAALVSGGIMAAVLFAVFYRKALSKVILKCFGASVLISAAVILSVELIPNIRYVNYIPKPDEVDSAVIYNCEDNMSGIDLLSNLIYIALPNNYYSTDQTYSYTFKSDEAKQKIFELHSRMLDENTKDNLYSADYYDNGYNSIKIVYNLKNGKKVTRFYNAGAKDTYKEYAALFQTDEGIAQLPLLNVPKDRILFLEVEPYASIEDDELSEELSQIVKLDDYTEFQECIRHDMQREPAYEFILNPDLNFYAWFYDYDAENPKDLNITIYALTEFATEEHRELFSKMTRQEIEDYSFAHFENSGFEEELVNSYEYDVWENKSEVVNYLKKLGYSFDQFKAQN